MDTRRTAQIVAWTMIGTIAGGVVSALGILYFLPPSVQHQPPWANVIGYALAFALLGAFGVPPGFAGGFLMGVYAASIRRFRKRTLGAALIGALVGWGYGFLLTRLLGHDGSLAFLPLFAFKAGAAGGVLTSLSIEVIRRAFER